jgi:UDPglucose 6-dehydrogenase
VRIGVCGLGVVGSAVSAGLARLGHEVVGHDIKLQTKLEDLTPCEVVFLCVPTPSREDGSCDTSIVEDTIKKLSGFYRGIVAIKSTVEPGFTKAMQARYTAKGSKIAEICFVPEFLRERSAFYDFTEGHDLLAVGTNSDRVFNTIVALHGKYPKTVVKLTPTEAELLKYYSNVYNAMRVTFANGFYDVCKKLDADYSKVKTAFVSRGTAKDMYLDCNENMRGFAGMCLPKETKAFAALSGKLGVPAKIFTTIIEDNELYKKTIIGDMRL